MRIQGNQEQPMMNMVAEDGQPIQGSIEALDPLNRMPPGHSLTGPQGKWAWDKPALYSDPEDAIDFIIDKLENPDVESDMLNIMTAGVSIEEMVETIALGGFATGVYTPDVAEIIKGPIAMYLAGLAVENGIPPKMFNTKTGMPPSNERVTQAQVMNIMQDREPERIDAINMALDDQEQAMIEEDQINNKSFLSPKLDETPEETEDATVT
tara:strand:- start:1060 stop:1689 length:630 start_codon:yes stop_codon:yes gene_type:complete